MAAGAITGEGEGDGEGPAPGGRGLFDAVREARGVPLADEARGVAIAVALADDEVAGERVGAAEALAPGALAPPEALAVAHVLAVALNALGSSDGAAEALAAAEGETADRVAAAVAGALGVSADRVAAAVAVPELEAAPEFDDEAVAERVHMQEQ
jgi:hypothetical protein